VDRPAEDALRLERRAAPQPSVQAAAPAADASAPAERRRTADQRSQEAQERPADADDRRRSFAAAAPATARAGADPLEPITHLVALRPDDLHWASAGRSHPHGFAQRAWLDTLGALTAGRWERTRTTERDGTPVQLFDGPRVRAEWLIGPQRVLLLDAERGAWQAPLSNADAARLRALADGW
jgi:hypothetical protein